jgi:hypothetical protein
LAARAGDFGAALFELDRLAAVRRVAVRDDWRFAPARVGRFLAFLAITV